MVDSGADAASGPYGPGNPPPPPSGPPPSTKERKRSRGNDTYLSPPQDSLPAKGPGRAFLHRKLNSRQRKHFRDQQAELVEQQDRGRSCSPPPREPQTSQERYRERSDMRRDNGREQPDSGWTTRKSRRKSLRDARRITPDQIMEQTPGRLSLPRAYGGSDFYQDERAVLRSTKRTDWPDGRSSRPRSDAGKHVTGTRGPTSERSGADTYRPQGVASYIDNPEPTWQAGLKPRSAISIPEVRPQAYGIEDEVDWDDDDIDVPIPAVSLDKPNAGSFRPQRPAENSYTRYTSAQGSMRSASPAPAQQKLEQRPWMNTSKQFQIKPTWAVQPEQQPSKAKFDRRRKGRGIGDPFHNNGPVEQESFESPPRRSLLEETSSHLTALAQIKTPDTVYDLREYDVYITNMHANLPKNKAYRNGNGKSAPHNYGSVPGQDLGLCFVTFLTDGWCEMGVKCAWRHHPLTRVEREWILQLGRERSKRFLENLPKFWATPEVPVPGANMEDKVKTKSWRHAAI